MQHKEVSSFDLTVFLQKHTWLAFIFFENKTSHFLLVTDQTLSFTVTCHVTMMRYKSQMKR